MPKPKPPYTAQFREQKVELVRAGRKPGERSSRARPGIHPLRLTQKNTGSWMADRVRHDMLPTACGPIS